MLTALLALALQITPQSGAAIVPMEAGASWVFSARVRWTLPDSNRVRRSSIRREMRITEVHESEGIKAAVVRGFPFPLAWYEPGERPGFDVLVKRSDGLWLAGANSEEEAKELAKRAVAGEAIGEMLLRFPVRVGDCVGGDPDRTDGRYRWSVERRIKEQGVPGWEIAYRTNPDHQFLRLVPGLGITGFTYEHHGTVASARARLVRSVPGRR